MATAEQITLANLCWQTDTSLLFILPERQNLALSPFLRQKSATFVPFYSLTEHLNQEPLFVQFPFEAPNTASKQAFYNCLEHLQILLAKNKQPLTLSISHSLLYNPDLYLISTLACHIPVRIQLNEEQFGWCTPGPVPEHFLNSYREPPTHTTFNDQNLSLNTEKFRTCKIREQYPLFEQLYQLLNRQSHIPQRDALFWLRRCPTIPISPLAWSELLRWGQSTLDALPKLQTDWNLLGLLLAWATGCSHIETVYFAAPPKLQNSLQDFLFRENPPEQDLHWERKALSEFQPLINSRFQYIATEQLQQIPVQERGNISIYDAQGNASGPYSCKRISEQEFQISNPYLGYQVSNYLLTGKQLVPERNNPEAVSPEEKEIRASLEFELPQDLDHILQKYLGFPLRQILESVRNL